MGHLIKRNPRVGDDDFFVARKVLLEIQVIDGKRGKSTKHLFIFKDAEKQVNDFFQPTFFWSPKSMLTKLGNPHVEPAYRMVLCV